jgi:hypothetical protein
MGGYRTLWGRRRVGIGGRRGIIGVEIGGFCGRSGVGIGGFCGRNGVRNDRGGASRSAGLRGVGGRAGRHRQRRLSCHQALCGDSGQPLPRYEPCWHPASALRALVAPRIRAARLDGTPHPLHGAYRSRGRPESPPISSRYLNRLWRCRPARPPTSRNTPLRAAPIRADFHPDDPTPTVDSHPSAAPRRADSHPDTHQRTETPRCARRRSAPIRTRLRPHDASIPTPIPTNASEPRPARRPAMRRFAPACGPTARRSPP